MRDSVGGTVVIAIIMVFIVLVLSYLAFNVNYTKAFRMKNKIIATYEDFDGNCNDECEKIINLYAKEIGYKPGNLRCPSTSTDWHKKDYYCVLEVPVNRKSDNDNSSSDVSSRDKNDNPDQVIIDSKKKVYYKVVTVINIDIPIVKNIMPYDMFRVTGDTKSFYAK